MREISSRLYKLALWYIKKCNAKWENWHKDKVESLDRLTYWNFGKYMLLYGADAEWQIFSRYDVLDNAIQRLAEYENIGTIKECRTAVERMKPTKVTEMFARNDGIMVYRCPICQSYVIYEHEQRHDKYGANCGQRLNWE